MSQLIPGYEYRSRAEEMWALVVEALAGWEQRMSATAAAAGLSPVSAWALVQLEPGVSISQKELAARMRCNPSTVVDPTDRLEEARMVIRRPNPEDRRVNVLVVTPKGVRARKKLIAQLLEPPAAFQRMPAADQSRFRAVMIESLRGNGPKKR
jgi:MarR family transcriptional regulator, organic hydroperoxide resistance regulator